MSHLLRGRYEEACRAAVDLSDGPVVSLTIGGDGECGTALARDRHEKLAQFQCLFLAVDFKHCRVGRGAYERDFFRGFLSRRNGARILAVDDDDGFAGK